MQILKNNDNINKYIKKKSYSQSQLKEIGRINSITKGGNNSFIPYFVTLNHRIQFNCEL
jgi:cadmium resistance protein CadD (predicted permease)